MGRWNTATCSWAEPPGKASLPLVPVLCAVRLLIVSFSIPRPPLPPRPSDPAAPLSGHLSGVFVPWFIEMLSDSFRYHEAFGSLRWAPGWWWPQTGSGSGWRFPTVSPPGSAFGWTRLCAKVLQPRVKHQQWWPMMEKDVGDSRVLAKLGSLAEVLASALGRCGAKSCQSPTLRFTMWTGTLGNFLFLYWPLWVSS